MSQAWTLAPSAWPVHRAKSKLGVGVWRVVEGLCPQMPGKSHGGFVRVSLVAVCDVRVNRNYVTGM